MTRKDYVLIAGAIQQVMPTWVIDPYAHKLIKAGVDRSAVHIAYALQRDNPRFDRRRFLKACGVEA